MNPSPSRQPCRGRLLVLAVLLACAFVADGSLPALGAGTVTVTSPDGVNLRAAPDTQAQVLAAIPFGSVLTVTGEPSSDGWFPVSFGSMSGWAAGAYLAQGTINPQSAQNTAPLAAVVPAAPSAAAATTTASAASSAASVVSAITPLPSSASAASTAPAATGTIALSTTNSLGASASTTASGATPMVVNTDALNVRAAPDSKGAIVTTLTHGSIVQVTGPATGGIWQPVTYNGIAGWADVAYLAPLGAGATPAGSASTASTANSTSASLTSASLATGTAMTAATFGNPTLGKPAGPETGLTVAIAPAAMRGKFLWPVSKHDITTTFQPSHQAVDIGQFPQGGFPASASADGIVSYAGGDACCSYGLYVIIQHRDGYSSLYAHLSKIEVSQGQIVKQGQEIGLTGNTGNSTGPHIHFAIYLNGNPLDPLSVLPGAAQIDTTADCYPC